MYKIRYESFRSHFREARLPFGLAYRLCPRDAPRLYKLSRLQGVWWIRKGRSHWLYVEKQT